MSVNGEGWIMAKSKKQKPIWKCRNLKTGFEPEGMLEAYWEVALDPISDEYTPQEVDAFELFYMWERQVSERYTQGLIPIYWFLEYKGANVSTFEGMPFQFEHISDSFHEDFLTFFSWPVNSITGEPLNWLTLPVVDKLWNPKISDKGGFIQQATGWKPSILQPYVFLPALVSALRKRE